MKTELNYSSIYSKVVKRKKLTYEEKKIFHEKMVFRHNLAQKWYKKYDERVQKKKEKAKAWDELVKRVERRYPNREPIKIVNKSKIFK